MTENLLKFKQQQCVFVSYKIKMLSESKIFVNFYKYKRKFEHSLRVFGRYTFAAQDNKVQQTDETPARILFFGTDKFSLPSLKLLHENSLKQDFSLGVVTSFKQPANIVRLYAEDQKLPLFKWPVPVEVCQGYDLGIVVSFGHLIPEKIIRSFSKGMINVHASLLPRWRGAAPIIYAIMNGDSETGVSIMRIEPKHFDVGEILCQKPIKIKEDVKMPELHEELATEGAQLLLNVVNNYDEYSKKAYKQNEEKVSYAPKVTTDLTEICWSNSKAVQIYQLFRALYGFKPLITYFRGKNVQLLDIELPKTVNQMNIAEKLRPGQFLYCRYRKCLIVQCEDGHALEIHRLRLEGKKVMSALEFYNGFLKNSQTKHYMFENKNT